MAMSLDIQFNQTQHTVQNHYKTIKMKNQTKPTVTEEGRTALATETASDKRAAAFIPTPELCELISLDM